MTGKSKIITVEGVEITYFNQRCKDWTHPYEWQHNGSTLSNAGCGIFSLCHCAQWLTGKVQSPEAWADFACTYGGRGDDGTDRTILLHTLMVHGKAQELGFRYEEDGLRNDKEALFDFLLKGEGVAMCNLRVGHIVALLGARVKDGHREILAVDSYSESASEKVRDAVTEVIPGTEVVYPVKNTQGLIVGENIAYAAFWVDADLPMDFNFLHRI